MPDLTAPTTTDPIQSVEQTVDKDYLELTNFQTAKVRLEKLISDFSPVIINTAENRDHRYKDINIKALRDKGEILPNQFLCPVRAIDSNIRREQPAYINYLKQSRRLIIFRNRLNALEVTSDLEDEFTRGMTYSGWETPHFKCVDGAQTHGWDAVEVIFDTTKPLHVAIEHVGRDRLIFPTDAQDIQACEVILRCFAVTQKQLKELVKKFSFSPVEVQKIIDKQAEMKKEMTVNIYKKFCKYDGIVYVSWFSLTCDDWLKAPQKLYVGIDNLQTRTISVNQPQQTIDPATGQPTIINVPTPQQEQYWNPVDANLYPIFILPYNETEQPRIASHKGRVFLDKHKQEAKTANLSQFVNGCQNASNTYPYLEGETGKTAKELESIKIAPNTIPPIPIRYWSPPYPDAVMLNLQQYLDSFDAQEVGKIDFAALNRKDSRKTATEVQAAQQETGLLNSVQLTLYSTFIREVYTYAWEIVKSRAAQNLITFLTNPATGQNNIERLNQPYDLRAAGDIDVVKRNELIAQYKDFWPIIQNTPIALQFLSRLIRLSFPEEGDIYAQMLQAGDPRILVVQLANVLKASIDDDEFRALSPQDQQNLMQLLQAANGIEMTMKAEAGMNPKEANNQQSNTAQSAVSPPAPAQQQATETANTQ